MIIKKRQLLLATLVIALAAAVFVNWYYTRPEIESANAKTESATAPEVKEGVNLGDARYVISTDASLDDTALQAQANEYFASAKLRRQNAHDEAAEALNDIIKDGSSSSEAVSKASSALEELAKSISLESDIENLIVAKAGCENLVILNGGNAEIIVENGALDEVSIIKIKEIAVEQTGYSVDKISITEMEY
ncbi:MAG: SpoIIIAH-like family protein [Acutalibacteraceae bacterium]|nr:SpoIIIAH-like family protein [Acutalibacteraceae bacterium]